MRLLTIVGLAIVVSLALASTVGGAGAPTRGGAGITGAGGYADSSRVAGWAVVGIDTTSYADSAGVIQDNGLKLRMIPTGLITGPKLNPTITKDSLNWSATLMRLGTKFAAGAQVYQWEIVPDSTQGGITVSAGPSEGVNAFTTSQIRAYHAAGHVASPANEGKAGVMGYSDYTSSGRGIYGYLGSHRIDQLGVAIYGDCTGGTDSVGYAFYGNATGTDYGLYLSGGRSYIPAGLQAGRTNIDGGLFVTGPACTLYVGDTTTVILPAGSILYDYLATAAQESSHTWAAWSAASDSAALADSALGAVNAQSAVWALTAGLATNSTESVHATAADSALISASSYLAILANDLVNPPTSIDSAVVAAYAYAAAYADTAGKAGYADSAGLAGYASSAGFADLAGGLSAGVWADSALYASLAAYCDSAAKAVLAESAAVAGSANSAAYADTAQDAGHATLADTSAVSGHSDTADSSGKAALADSCPVTALADSAGVTALADSSAKSALADSAAKAALADSAAKAALADSTPVPALADSAKVAALADSAAKAALADSTPTANHAVAADSSGKSAKSDSATVVAAAFKPTTAGTADDVVARAIDGLNLSGYLRVRAGQDTARIRADTYAGSFDNTITKVFEVIGAGYVENMFFDAVVADSAAFAIIRVDGAMACSIQVRDLVGFPLAYVASADSDKVTDRILRHYFGISQAGTGALAVSINQIIPFGDSIKVFIKKTTGASAWEGHCLYRLTDISDWGAFSHWHATVTKADTAGNPGGDSTQVIFDSGTITGQGIYLGTSGLLTNPAADGLGVLERPVQFRYAAEAGVTISPTVRTWFLTGLLYASYLAEPGAATSATQPDMGVYQETADTAYGMYRFFYDRPAWFTTRFRVQIGGLTESPCRARCVSFWYSAN